VSELRVRIKRTESVSTRAMFYDQMTIWRERDRERRRSWMRGSLLAQCSKIIQPDKIKS
jgi:hypothetical protein